MVVPNPPPRIPKLVQQPAASLTPLQKLGLRLSQFPGRMVQVMVMVDEQGEPVVVVVEDMGKAEVLRTN